eukprot:scaffold110647_cov54-Phaeocystis_antarctica.AAC.3
MQPGTNSPPSSRACVTLPSTRDQPNRSWPKLRFSESPTSHLRAFDACDSCTPLEGASSCFPLLELLPKGCSRPASKLNECSNVQRVE